jgi:hypothetical protein
MAGRGAWANNPNVVAVDGSGAPLLDGLGNPVKVPMIAYYGTGTGSDALSCRVAVHYRIFPFEVRTDAQVAALTQGELERYVERQVHRALRTQNLIQQVKFYEGPPVGNFIPANGNQKIIPDETLTYIWYDVPDPPYAAWDACTGFVNNAPFDGAKGEKTYAAGTLLCKAPQKIRYRNVIGRITHKIV